MSPLRDIDGVKRDATNPCALAISAKGYELSIIFSRGSDGQLEPEYTAEKDGVRITAVNEVELLGLVTMREMRGPNWETQHGELYIYDVLYSESYVREADGTVIENPERWF